MHEQFNQQRQHILPYCLNLTLVHSSPIKNSAHVASHELGIQHEYHNTLFSQGDHQ